MILDYDLKRISGALWDFSRATGVNIQICDKDFRFPDFRVEHNKYCGMIQSVKEGRLMCNRSDTKLLEACRRSLDVEMHTCHAGLTDIAVPIIAEGEAVAFMILGQIREDDDFGRALPYIRDIIPGAEKMEEYYLELPKITGDRLTSLVNVVRMLVNYVLSENMVIPKRSGFLERAIAFIDANLTDKLDIRSISRGVGISTSALYREFHSHLGCTVSEYINAKRAEHAAGLLLHTDLSVEEISARVGFSSSAYLALNFRKKYGTSPLKYRKSFKSI